jgi:hypothetical protein
MKAKRFSWGTPGPNLKNPLGRTWGQAAQEEDQWLSPCSFFHEDSVPMPLAGEGFVQ